MCCILVELQPQSQANGDQKALQQKVYNECHENRQDRLYLGASSGFRTGPDRVKKAPAADKTRVESKAAQQVIS